VVDRAIERRSFCTTPDAFVKKYPGNLLYRRFGEDSALHTG
jgi:hypothetical protein